MSPDEALKSPLLLVVDLLLSTFLLFWSLSCNKLDTGGAVLAVVLLPQRLW